MLRKHTVCKEGETLTPEQADILVRRLKYDFVSIGRENVLFKTKRIKSGFEINACPRQAEIASGKLFLAELAQRAS